MTFGIVSILLGFKIYVTHQGLKSHVTYLARVAMSRWYNVPLPYAAVFHTHYNYIHVFSTAIPRSFDGLGTRALTKVEA
jgi:hypothetical protein